MKYSNELWSSRLRVSGIWILNKHFCWNVYDQRSCKAHNSFLLLGKKQTEIHSYMFALYNCSYLLRFFFFFILLKQLQSLVLKLESPSLGCVTWVVLVLLCVLLCPACHWQRQRHAPWASSSQRHWALFSTRPAQPCRACIVEESCFSGPVGYN